MCGIAAMMSSSEQVGFRPWLDRVCKAMEKRGPDGAGQWYGPGIALGHRRLSIIDLSERAGQPMFSADGRLCIVFNGEIYNYRALRADLEQDGVVFVSESDTEVLLHLYHRYGQAMFDHLRGMYAFALWDSQRRGLLLGRDPFGIKPLYLVDDGRTCRVASQVKALLAGGDINTGADAAGHVGFYLWGHVPEPFTLYRSIRSVPAGSWLWLGQDGERRQGRHFCLNQELGQVKPGLVDLGPVVADSVAHHMIADVPVGVFLSAGIDSAVLCHLAGSGVETLTLGFDALVSSPVDEVPIARKVAASWGRSHHVAMVGKDDFAAAQAQILADMDQPSIDGVNTWMVAREAHRLGWKVALSGVGGDELFGGYDTFSRVPRWERHLRPLATVPGLGRGLRWVCANWLRRVCPPKVAGLFELGGRAEGGYLLRRGLFMPWELAQLMDGDMVHEGWVDLQTLSQLAEVTRGLHGQARINAMELSFYMRNQLLRDSDWAGMAHSLEIRLPLVDITLFRALAPAIVSPQPPTKDLFAASFGVPALVRERTKTGFNVPVGNWLGVPGGIRAWAGHVASAFSIT